MSFAAAMLPGGRLHLQHGPIDLVIGAEGDREEAFRAARAAFEGVLEALVDELDLLRRDGWSGATPPCAVTGPVARRMVQAVAWHTGFVTPMAAVAGAVADYVLGAMVAAGELRRAFVNNGGDIALHLASGARFRLAVTGLDGAGLGAVEIAAEDGIGGIATSGQGGRSLSLGIAESVTVLARDAADADAAATLIANAVDLPEHAAIRRAPARQLRPDSDLGDRPVVVGVGPLRPQEAEVALRNGVRVAEAMQAGGRIHAAILFLRGRVRMVGECREVLQREVERA
ncbi:UPF0280 family protein [Marimonas arenosa]|uniref:UPF0280 family protein n=1 Tax=Marimonas arenosa TaxID=1795305 RepID=A0AAE3WCM3_9RHOB|nr:UPF0280 family protein [Marimonas arenosa]MDQ2089985.1 UPF0280 family protein [Marimonas arenosa]